MIIGHIGARHGSKGVPGKNLKSINGKPLIQYSIDQIETVGLCDHLVISTDSRDILQTVSSRLLLDIGIRPANLASDAAAKIDAWRWAGKVVSEVIGDDDITFIDLDCTAPLRLVTDIDAAYSLHLKHPRQLVMSACVARKNPYFNLVELDDSGFAKLSKEPAKNVVRRQDAPVVYEHAASIYVFKPGLLRPGGFYDQDLIIFEMPWLRCLDIDSIDDFDLVEMIMKNREIWQ